ncbi:hypothetical protein NLI96_g11988 [Meripilus lineatus]|uniref:N-acetyltransferase domain-containing protein n=1 Tax=Meripilus lineatus TaxID=2056292 RepID=A0AAD5UVN5_9APHY|nr:hypothetical protein NLI96_g11988 [Physisporinus lineatus]
MSSQSDPEWDDPEDEEYSGTPQRRRSKLRRLTRSRNDREHSVVSTAASSESAPGGTDLFTFDSLIAALDDMGEEEAFDVFVEPLIDEYSRAILDAQDGLACDTTMNMRVAPISRMQARRILDDIASGTNSQNPTANLIARRLKTNRNPLRASLLCQHKPYISIGPTDPVPSVRNGVAVNPQVLEGLYDIQTTPYANSFLSRLQGFQPNRSPGVLHSDWESQAPWMDLMQDIREHYTLMHPDREVSAEYDAPIDYSTLRQEHLPQTHDLLHRIFWEGINVSDSLEYSPEKCTVIATYKHLVVGVALLSSPQETYITYLASDPAGKTRKLRHITLHVSINNPAVLLYNRFGFKAEEFIVGFYEDYLDTQSRASKNAFRLRLRQS